MKFDRLAKRELFDVIEIAVSETVENAEPLTNSTF
jgi:hypothetical protein